MNKSLDNPVEPPDDDDIQDWQPISNHPLLVNYLVFILLQGIPGSGKSTYAAFLKRERENTEILCPDTIRGELSNGDQNDQSRNAFIFNTLIPARIVGLKAHGKNVVFDATNYSRRARKSIIRQARELGYNIEVHVLRVPVEECHKRNEKRAKRVPPEVIDRMARGWEDPEEDEGIDEIVEVPANWMEDTVKKLSQEVMETHKGLFQRLADYDKEDGKGVDNKPQVT